MGYEIYGLKENPFPKGGAIVKPESTDPRENGSIFSVEARKKEINEFEEKFIGKGTTFDERLRCGFIWASGDRTSGRGMGKTSLSVYFMHRINDEGFGKKYFGGNTKFFCCYISFNQQIKSKISFLYKQAFNSLISHGIFNEIQKTTTQTALEDGKVSKDFATAIMNRQVKEYLESMSKYRLDEMSTAWDTKFLSKLQDLFLNQTIAALKTSGFVGGIIIVDDLENLTDKSTPREIENFIKDLGMAFFRSNNAASNDTFFTLILTTHQQSADKISGAWRVAGLSSAFPLNHNGRHSVLTGAPDVEQGLDMVAQYLKKYKNDNVESRDKFYPFTEDAIKYVITESGYNPRQFLSRLRQIITEALKKQIKQIDIEFVKTVPAEEDENDQNIGNIVNL